MNRLIVVPAVALAWAACADDPGWVPPADTSTGTDAPWDTDGGADPAADTSVPDGPPDMDAHDPLLDPDASDPEPDDGGPATLPMCMQRCSSSSECGTPSTPAFDSDNYTCTGGFCIYTGCNSDSECTGSMGAGYGCNHTMSPAYCTETCATYADCGIPTMPAYTSDHYDCTGGYCAYTGCLTDSECRDTVGAEYGCNHTMSPAYCSETCSTASTCGTPSSPAYDSDNYDCTGGYCVYTGCNSDTECIDSVGAGYGCMGL